MAVSIQAGKLTSPQYTSKVGTILSPHRQEVADTLTPQRLGQLMRAADEGDIEAYLTLAEEMEEREPHYASVLQTRKLAVSGVPPMVEAPDDSPEQKKIVEAIEERIVNLPMFEGLVQDLLDGIPKGFACIEIDWQRDPSEWYPKAFNARPQRHFMLDLDTMTRPLLRVDGAGMDEGEELRPFKWLVHTPKLKSGTPIHAGLARTIAVCYAAKRWTVADWMAFLDIFGIPVRVGKYPAHMAAKKSDLLRAIRRIGSDAAAVIPTEMEVELLEAKGQGGGETLFQKSAEYWDKQTSKVVLGQTMTTDDGASLAQSKIHENTKFEIRDADSRAVCATIDRDLFKPFVMLNFGEQKRYPHLRIRQRRVEDLVQLMAATKIYVELGGRVQASEVRDRLGFAEPEEGAELLTPAAKPAPIGAETEGDTELDDPAKDKKKIDGEGRDAELNTSKAERARIYDATDEHLERELQDWRSLEETNVGRLIALIQNAESYDEARALLEELAHDEGQVLDVGALVVSLARGTFKLRGIGDATDAVKP